MLGKRKRCNSPPALLPSPPQANSFNFSPISSNSTSPFSGAPPATSSAFMSSLHAARDRLRGESSSRTQKRTRNRGSEKGIYENTLKMLFGASKAQTLSKSGMEVDEGPKCEDCDGGLAEEELYEEGEGRCMNCRRMVCKAGNCCVETTSWNGGQGRLCLGCALR